MTVKRIIAFIILAPVAVALVAFIVANRTLVRLAFNPFNPDEGTLSFTAPLFVWLFVFLAIGILVGSTTTWLTQHKYRKSARGWQAELNACRIQLRQKQKESHIS